VADVSQEITGGNGPFLGESSGASTSDAGLVSVGLSVPDGFVAHEYVATGTATAYAAQGTLGNDGVWTLAPVTAGSGDGGRGGPAAYRTRVLVRRPSDMSHFSGTVVVEWLNVSGGLDADPDYASLEEEIVRRGHVWVGVSAQLIGVSGGPVLVQAPGGGSYTGKGLKKIDPARYGTLDHPGDGYSFDIFTQVARAVLAGGNLTAGAKPSFVIAAGESQSAFALTTYYDGVQPLTLAFDGFFVHSRGAQSLPLVGPGAYADLTSAIGSATQPVFRGDLDAPVLDLQAETDVTGILSSVNARQPDSDRFRLWETAGTAHADAHLLGPIASSVDCGVPINNGPMHVIAKAAFHELEIWVRAGTLPPIAPRLNVSTAAPPAINRDSDGIALGGIRTPPVDVPVDVLSGVPGPNSNLLCILLGSTKPLPDARIAQLYKNRADYQQKYDAGTSAAIQAGFALDADRAALEAFAEPSRVQP
jgi:hypothetical protein